MTSGIITSHFHIYFPSLVKALHIFCTEGWITVFSDNTVIFNYTLSATFFWQSELFRAQSHGLTGFIKTDKLNRIISLSSLPFCTTEYIWSLFIYFFNELLPPLLPTGFFNKDANGHFDLVLMRKMCSEILL